MNGLVVLLAVTLLAGQEKSSPDAVKALVQKLRSESDRRATDLIRRYHGLE